MQRHPIVQVIPILPPRFDKELQHEYEMHNYRETVPMVISISAQESEVTQMCRALAERLKDTETHDSSNMNADMCLVPDVVIPLSRVKNDESISMIVMTKKSFLKPHKGK